MTNAEAEREQETKNLAWWDAYFADEGGWEKNGGKTQTRIFAETFCRLVRYDREVPMSLLDVGCALGGALKVFRREYPLARLFGMDSSQVAVERCCRDLDSVAEFFVGTLEGINIRYDVIYASAILEHLRDWESVARHLAAHCSRLGVTVPYREYRDGRDMVPNGDSSSHQHTFYRDSFDFLLAENIAREVRVYVRSCPGAWGWTLRDRLTQTALNMARLVIGRPMLFNPHMMFVDIVTYQDAIPVDGTKEAKEGQST